MVLAVIDVAVAGAKRVVVAFRVPACAPNHGLSVVGEVNDWSAVATRQRRAGRGSSPGWCCRSLEPSTSAAQANGEGGGRGVGVFCSMRELLDPVGGVGVRVRCGLRPGWRALWQVLEGGQP
jgi:hypothetical protein